MCESIWVLSTTSGALCLWGFLKFAAGEGRGFLCVPSRFFFWTREFSRSCQCFGQKKDEWGVLWNLTARCWKGPVGLLASGPEVCQRRVALLGRAPALKTADQGSWQFWLRWHYSGINECTKARCISKRTFLTFHLPLAAPMAQKQGAWYLFAWLLMRKAFGMT